MSFIFPPQAKTAYKQHNPEEMTKQHGRNPGANKNTGSKSHQPDPPHLIESAHKNTPCTILCRGCLSHCTGIFSNTDLQDERTLEAMGIHTALP